MALNSLAETMRAPPSRSGKYPWRAFPFNLSRATCRPGLVSPATSHRGRRGIVAGDSGKCCSDIRLLNDGFKGKRCDLHLNYWMGIG
ncbi:hypothetical protein Tco_1452784, partial [Tanacetum coccineum]